MERICRVCNQSKNTPYRDICRGCYQKEWVKTITEKICTSCEKTFKNAGKQCWPCQQNLRNKYSRWTHCSCCLRVGLIIANVTERLCIKCNRQKKEAADPSLADKRRDYLMKYSRKKKGTDVNAPKRESSGKWKTAAGYVLIYKPEHANRDINGCILEHTFVMSEKLGRPLREKENVHHINGIRDDNRIDNLELWHRGQCPGQRLEEKLQWCKEFLLGYGYRIDDP